MGDMAEDFKALREYNGMRRDKRVKLNCDILDKSGIDFTVSPRGFYFLSLPEYPRCIFYPSTGRWIHVNHGLSKRGGAKKFLEWLKANTIKETTDGTLFKTH